MTVGHKTSWDLPTKMEMELKKIPNWLFHGLRKLPIMGIGMHFIIWEDTINMDYL